MSAALDKWRLFSRLTRCKKLPAYAPQSVPFDSGDPFGGETRLLTLNGAPGLRAILAPDAKLKARKAAQKGTSK